MPKYTTQTDELLIKTWEALIDGQGCGCPSCSRDLLDEIATRFRQRRHDTLRELAQVIASATAHHTEGTQKS